jgi:acyl dehydratase
MMPRVGKLTISWKEGRGRLNWHTVGVRFLSVVKPGAVLTVWISCIQVFGCGLSGNGGFKVVSGIEELFKFICGRK